MTAAAGCGATTPGWAPDSAGWRFNPQAQYRYGQVSGKLQTPTGGNPGTTTANRPTLKELGFRHASAYDVSATADLAAHQIYAGYRFLRLSGGSVLDEPLISQGHSFPAGAEVDADVRLDWLRAGYAHRFTVGLPGDLPDVALYPALGGAVLDFDYRLRQSGAGGDVHRAYVLPTPQVGLGAAWPLTRRLSLVAGGLASIPIGDMPEIRSAEFTARYRMFTRNRFEAEAVIGVGYDQIRYNDSGRQTVPNDIDVEFGPALVAGLSIRF